jgi:hypothetical protein
VFSGPFAYDAGLAIEPLLTQLAPELSGIATALLPALLQVFLMLIDCIRLSNAPCRGAEFRDGLEL